MLRRRYIILIALFLSLVGVGVGATLFFTKPTPPTSSPADTIDHFYRALASQDLIAVNALFAPDASTEDASLRSRLFQGKDTDGTPGGPTFGQSNSATFMVQGHTLHEKSPLHYVVTETRMIGEATHQVDVSLVLTRTSERWLLNRYSYMGNNGTYSGFLLE